MSKIAPAAIHRLAGQDATRTCWRMAAIYRCCIRYGKDEAWALRKVREIFPSGSRDAVVTNWFTDMAALQERHLRLNSAVEDAPGMAMAA
ncbi:hypothetical protein [Defluviimonas salinarum]|uniref:Uncharacterized protein n=1 Tax=Defluviimonas salinarum TaxID=2992147 RepID=A0ABT3J9C4_9RHOB|nr:hypothetical protein [Defluviimonas salinarum]MCW3784292.1 hypothetical protein [Defluviimonas salinarum]